MDSEVIVRIDRSFGRCRYYAANDISRFLCDLLKAKSLTIEQIKIIKDFGWTVSVEQERISL